VTRILASTLQPSQPPPTSIAHVFALCNDCLAIERRKIHGHGEDDQEMHKGTLATLMSKHLKIVAMSMAVAWFSSSS
jgi:hypothetical protein